MTHPPRPLLLTEETPSRRAIFAGLAAAPVAALAGPALAPPAAASAENACPTLPAIREYFRLREIELAAWAESERHDTNENYDAAVDCQWDTHAALEAAFLTTPISVAGAIGLLEAVAIVQEETDGASYTYLDARDVVARRMREAIAILAAATGVRL